MMRIAIWGYGKYGRRMFESLTRFCYEEYEIVRVYDKAYQTLKYTEGEMSLKIHNPEELPEDYKTGLFEKVLIPVHIYSFSQEMRQFLQERSIPELHLGHPDDLSPLSSFNQGRKPFEINRAGYEFYVIEHLYGALPNYERFEVLYLFNDEGKVVQEHTDRFDPDLDSAGLNLGFVGFYLDSSSSGSVGSLLETVWLSHREFRRFFSGIEEVVLCLALALNQTERDRKFF